MRKQVIALLIIALLALPTTIALSYTYERGNETIDIEPASGQPLKTYINITLNGFPTSKTVEIYFGSFKVATTRTNSTGQAFIKNMLLPELPGGYTLVTARIPDLGIVASEYFDITPYIELLDSSNKPVLPTTYMGDGDTLRVRGFGFLPGEIVTIEDDASSERNPISAGRVTDVITGQLGPSYIIADDHGSFDLKYRLKVEVDTGDVVTVSVSGEGNRYDTGSGDFTAQFLAAGPVSMSLSESEYIAQPGDEITIYVSSFNGLREDRRYQLMLDRSRLDIEVDGEDVNWFMPQNSTITFTVPNLSSGIHSLSIVYYGSSTPLAEHLFVVSKPGTTAKLALVRLEDGSPMPETVDKLVPGVEYMLVAYNFESSETNVYAYMYTDTDTDYYLGRVSIYDSGAGVETFTVPTMPAGTYSVYVTREVCGCPSPVVFDVMPKGELSPDEGNVGSTAWLDVSGLQPNTGYIVVYFTIPTGTSAAVPPTPLPNTTFVTDYDGSKSNIDFTIPSVPAGTYYVSVAPISNPDQVIELYGADGKVSYPTFKVTSEIKFNPSGEYIPFQLVTFEWDIGRDPDNDFVVVELDGTPIYTGTINPDSVQSAGTSTVYWSEGVIKGSFVMPNGEPSNIVFKIKAGDDEAVGVLKRVSGAGAFLEGTDLEKDVAYIKTETGEVAASLSDLDAKIVSIQGDVAYVRTNMGMVTTTLDAVNAALDTINGDMATIKTDIGDVSVKLDNVASLISSSSDQVVSKVEGKIKDVTSSISDLNSVLSGISSDLSNVKGNVAGLPSQLSAMDGRVQSLASQVTELTNYIYMIITLLAITIILSIVIILRRK